MEGLTPGAIAKELTADGIPTPLRKQCWQTSTVESILQNEKYKGAALLQKCFTVDFLTKKRKVNEGEVPQYYVEHSHEPIITPEEFDKVQTELAVFGALAAQELDALTKFDEKLWLTIIDTVTVHADGRMTFKFQGGKTLTSY